MSAESAAWQAILADGNLTKPGTTDTLKYDAAGNDGTGAVKLNKTITSQYPSHDTTEMSSSDFKSMTAESDVTVPALLKLLSLYPVDPTTPVGSIRLRNAGERLALRGGYYGYGVGAGLFGLRLASMRNFHSVATGFRPAFIL